MKYVSQINQYQPYDERSENEKRMIQEYMNTFSHNILTRDNEFAHMTSSGFIMNESLDKVLFIFHKQYNAWTWTGGHSDGEQDLLGTALREAMEETGGKRIIPLSDTMVSLDIIPVYGHIKRGKYVCSHLHLNATYVLIADETEQFQANPDEATAIKWLTISEIATYSNEPFLIEIYHRVLSRVHS